MPATSKKQFRAMQAAKAGKSNIGIPKKVGKEFVSATGSYSDLPETAPMNPQNLVKRKKATTKSGGY